MVAIALSTQGGTIIGGSGNADPYMYRFVYSIFI